MTQPVALMAFAQQTNIPSADSFQFITGDYRHCLTARSGAFQIYSLFDNTFPKWPVPSGDAYYFLENANIDTTYFDPQKNSLTFGIYQGAKIWDSRYGTRGSPSGNEPLSLDSTYAYFENYNGADTLFESYDLATLSVQKTIKDATGLAGTWYPRLYGYGVAGNAAHNTGTPGAYTDMWTDALTPCIPALSVLLNQSGPSWRLDTTNGMGVIVSNNTVTLQQVGALQLFTTSFNPQPCILLPGHFNLGVDAILLGLIESRNNLLNTSPVAIFPAAGNVFALFPGPNGFLDLYAVSNWQYIFEFYFRQKPIIMNNQTLGVKHHG